MGCLLFAAFSYVERRVARPLIPNGLWKTPGFVALLVAYFLGFGGFCELSRANLSPSPQISARLPSAVY